MPQCIIIHNIFIQFLLSFLESVFYSCDFHLYRFFKMTLHTNNRMSRKETVASASTVMTSSRKYWCQARSSTAERK